jgi:predicted oxidoreductase
VKDFESKVSLALRDFTSKPLDTRHLILLSLLEDMATRLPSGYAPTLLTLHDHLRTLHSTQSAELSLKHSDQVRDLTGKLDTQEKVMKELRKQIAVYKNEVQAFQKMDEYVNAENYQKLVIEYNQLYAHYKGVKHINKKLRTEIKQSNERERTFLKLLKKTQEYGAQASRLELEYDRLIKEDQRVNGGHTLETLIPDSAEKRQLKPEMVENGRGIKIPKLDLTSIYI